MSTELRGSERCPTLRRVPSATGAESGEDAIRQAHEQGDLRGAMDQAVRLYGPELLGYMTTLLRSEDWARDVFAKLLEDLWKGFEGFEWRSSFRTWAYRSARNAVYRARTRDRRPARLDTADMAALQAPEKSTTLPHLRTENKEWLAELRESLDPDEQTLLTLRIDRRMAWSDVALVLLGEEAEADPSRAAATVRKRFDRLKKRLRDAATERADQA